jgi:hypothetical protein
MEISFTTIAKGNSQFIRDVGVPLAESVEECFFASGVGRMETWPDEEVLWLDRRPKGEGTLIAGLFGVLCFLASWASSKLLDELYEAKVQPVIRAKLKSLAKPAEKSSKAFLIGVWLEDARVLVVALGPGKTIEDIASSLGEVPEILRLGIEYAASSGSTGEVHMYRVEGRVVQSHPRRYKNLMVALKEEGCA